MRSSAGVGRRRNGEQTLTGCYSSFAESSIIFFAAATEISGMKRVGTIRSKPHEAGSHSIVLEVKTESMTQLAGPFILLSPAKARDK